MTDNPKTFHGTPCKAYGHTLRYVSSPGTCVECQRISSAARYDSAAAVERTRAWAAANPEKARENKRHWRARNREKENAATRERRKTTPGGRAAEKALRRARESARCDCCRPEWFAFLYGVAKLAGAEVDHRLPLAMGGKHCARNLQVLPPGLHKAKTARDIAAIAAHRRDWLSANDSPDWAVTKVSPDVEIDLAGLVSEILMANPELINKFEY